jgi:hypothetical protein
MPIYTYTCLNCDKDYELMVPMEDRDKQPCKNCDHMLKRGVDRPGWVWSPTRNGGHS